MNRSTPFLIATLSHNRKLRDDIYRSGKSRDYNMDIIENAIVAITCELRMRGVIP